MKKLPIVTASYLVLSSLTFTLPAFGGRSPLKPHGITVFDSVGIEKKDGKRFILHRVDEGQTLFAIARRYGRSVADIRAANPDMNEAVRYDQLVRIPLADGALSKKEAKAIDKAVRKEEKEQKREAKAEQKADTKPTVTGGAVPTVRVEKDARKTDDPAKAGIHVVEPGQTLYSLAVRYGVSQADLRRWNNLSNDNVLIGQALIVSEKANQARMPGPSAPTVAVKSPDTPARRNDGDATYRPSVAVRPSEPRPTEPKPAENRPSEPRPTPNRRTDTEVVNRSAESKPDKSAPDTRRNDAPRNEGPSAARPTEAVEVELPRPGNDAPMPTHGRRLSDSGVAEMIEGDGSGKYLALHRTAPIGTLVQVRNEFSTLR